MCWQHILAPGWSGPLLVAFLCIWCPFTIGFCHLGYCYTTPVRRQRKMTCQLNTLQLSHFDFCLFLPFSFLVRFWNQSFLLQEDCTLTKITHFQKWQAVFQAVKGDLIQCANLRISYWKALSVPFRVIHYLIWFLFFSRLSMNWVLTRSHASPTYVLMSPQGPAYDLGGT